MEESRATATEPPSTADSAITAALDAATCSWVGARRLTSPLYSKSLMRRCGQYGYLISGERELNWVRQVRLGRGSPRQVLEATLADEIRRKRYTVDLLLSPMQIPSRRDGDSWGNALVDLHIKQYDHWAVISRHPRLARAFMSCPGLPTPASRRWFALASAFGISTSGSSTRSWWLAPIPADPGLWHSLAFAAVRQVEVSGRLRGVQGHGRQTRFWRRTGSPRSGADRLVRCERR